MEEDYVALHCLLRRASLTGVFVLQRCHTCRTFKQPFFFFLLITFRNFPLLILELFSVALSDVIEAQQVILWDTVLSNNIKHICPIKKQLLFCTNLLFFKYICATSIKFPLQSTQICSLGLICESCRLTSSSSKQANKLCRLEKMLDLTCSRTFCVLLHALVS